jgi:hypothetical protein
MTEAQKHFSQLVEQQKQLNADINALTSQLNLKRDMSLKVQGAIEYLEQTGVTFPTEEEITEETVEVELKEKKDLEKPKENPKNK